MARGVGVPALWLRGLRAVGSRICPRTFLQTGRWRVRGRREGRAGGAGGERPGRDSIAPVHKRTGHGRQGQRDDGNPEGGGRTALHPHAVIRVPLNRWFVLAGVRAGSWYHHAIHSRKGGRLRVDVSWHASGLNSVYHASV